MKRFSFAIATCILVSDRIRPRMGGDDRRTQNQPLRGRLSSDANRAVQVHVRGSL